MGIGREPPFIFSLVLPKRSRGNTERAINYPSSPVVYRDLSADSRLATGDPRLINEERAAVAEMAPPASLKVATAAAAAAA